MFSIDQKVTASELREKNIFRVYVSMNNHLVATPDTSLEEARSYVFIFHEGKRKLSFYIGLHLLLTGRKLFYAHSSNPLPEEDLQEVEEEARNFAEDLGAMLDEVNFANMSDLERERWIEEQSIFSDKKEPESAAEEQASRPGIDVVASSMKAPPVQEETTPAGEEINAPEAPVRSVVETSTAAAPEKTQKKEEEYEPEQQLKVTEPPLERTSEEARAAQLTVVKRRQEVTRNTVAVNSAKTQKQATGGGPAGVVSRDREALARLLTSF